VCEADDITDFYVPATSLPFGNCYNGIRADIMGGNSGCHRYAGRGAEDADVGKYEVEDEGAFCEIKDDT
jgi:hypothetical protein